MGTPGTPRPPRHIAVIMDGNGRWAKARGLPRLKGHHEGAKSVRAVLHACREIGVEYLTLYAFSVENWVRPEAEVKGLMFLLRKFLRDDEDELHEFQTRFRVIGRIQDLPAALRKEVRRVEDATRSYTRHTLTLALSYGGRAELVDATRAIAEKVRAGALDPAKIDEATIHDHLYCPELPDPDFMIRTSGEQRLSNFLLWQLSYAEFYFTPVLWPDFRREQLLEAVGVYHQRHRRFGDIA
ncbi:MAG: isoprenyl transferase [Kiritimatiellia bacterium]